MRLHRHTCVVCVGLATVLGLAGCSSTGQLDPREAEAAEAIQKLGGTITMESIDDKLSIVNVDMRRLKLQDSDLAPLANLSQLRTLHLARTDIGDEGLAHLGSLQHLEELHLGRTKVTDAGLQHLRGATGLKWISTGHTSVTPAGLKKLQRSLPELKSLR